MIHQAALFFQPWADTLTNHLNTVIDLIWFEKVQAGSAYFHFVSLHVLSLTVNLLFSTMTVCPAPTIFTFLVYLSLCAPHSLCQFLVLHCWSVCSIFSFSVLYLFCCFVFWSFACSSHNLVWPMPASTFCGTSSFSSFFLYNYTLKAKCSALENATGSNPGGFFFIDTNKYICQLPPPPPNIMDGTVWGAVSINCSICVRKVGLSLES